MIYVTLVINIATIGIGVATFRLQARTQRYLIITQFHISRRWRALGREDEAIASDKTERKLRRHLSVLSFLAFEWLVKPRALPEMPERMDRGA